MAHLTGRPLAVFIPDPVGSRVATFIRRHACDLLPGGTVVVAPNPRQTSEPLDWTVPGPILDLTRIIGGRLRWQVAHGIARQLGVQLDRLAVRRFLKRHLVRVVMGEYLDFSLQWLDVAQELGIPFFAHSHGHDVNDRLHDEKWRAAYLRYNDAGQIIANSYASRNALLAAGLDASRVHVVHLGVDVPSVPVTRPERREIRCIAVGRVVPDKAPILLLDSFRRALAGCPGLRLDYVGAGPLSPAVTDFIRALDLGEAVVAHGELPNAAVLTLLHNADIFIQHSVQEGLGVAILEAMAQGLPVVATRVGGIPESVADPTTGFLVEPGDTFAMAERIVALARDPDLRRRMGLAGWQRAKECFTWERERAELLKILGLSHVASLA